jgi:hypothetical protein
MPDAGMGTARGAGISLLQLSRPVRSTPKTSDDKVICPPFHPTSKQSDFGKKAVNKKRQRSLGLPAVSLNSITLPYNIHTLDVGSLPYPLSSGEVKPPCEEHPSILGSTHSCPIAVHIKPCAASILKVPV